MATEVVKRLINVDEYYKMAEVGILKPEDKVELINGEIFQISPIGSRHAAIVDHLAMILNQMFERNVIIRVQNPVRIDGNNQPEPDIAIVKYRSDYYSSAHPVPADVLAIIEVADFSIRFDKEVKTTVYASGGIPVYWIVDLKNNFIEIFSYPKGKKYTETKAYTPGDEATLLGKNIFIKEVLI
jgi:Uma2 family endonuclease